MFFQSLEISNSRIPVSLLEDFDLWLASLAPLYKDKINLTDYAIEKKLNLEFVNQIFDFAVERNVLKPKVIIVDDEGTSFGTFYKFKDIPLSMYDYELNREFQVLDANKEVWYELIDTPKDIPALGEKYSIDSKEVMPINRHTVNSLKKSGAGATLSELGYEF